ncbi:MAG: hypothetical protein Q8K78_14135 [Planctomycetaceae bacterium]|nr:hypothetical protein [Planctomycetaceae bacterium]
MTDLDEILDDLFHGCAVAAYVELAAACGGMPNQEATRQRAYYYYEEALAEKHSRSPRG